MSLVNRKERGKFTAALTDTRLGHIKTSHKRIKSTVRKYSFLKGERTEAASDSLCVSSCRVSSLKLTFIITLTESDCYEEISRLGTVNLLT